MLRLQQLHQNFRIDSVQIVELKTAKDKLIRQSHSDLMPTETIVLSSNQSVKKSSRLAFFAIYWPRWYPTFYWPYPSPNSSLSI